MTKRKKDSDIVFEQEEPIVIKGVKPIVIDPDPSPYRYLTKVICPRCKDLLLVYDSKDPLRLPMQEGEPLDKYNFCRNCGLKLDMSDFKIRYFVTHGGV